jgi:hypothetical protein
MPIPAFETRISSRPRRFSISAATSRPACVAAGHLERGDQLRRLQFVDIADDNGCALLREQFCDCSADTRRPACHQRNLALDLSAMSSSQSS